MVTYSLSHFLSRFTCHVFSNNTVSDLAVRLTVDDLCFVDVSVCDNSTKVLNHSYYG